MAKIQFSHDCTCYTKSKNQISVIKDFIAEVDNFLPSFPKTLEIAEVNRALDKQRGTTILTFLIKNQENLGEPDYKAILQAFRQAHDNQDGGFLDDIFISANQDYINIYLILTL